jgi:hypothetical protein
MCFLDLALVGDEWSALRPGHFTFEERVLGVHWMGGPKMGNYQLTYFFYNILQCPLKYCEFSVVQYNICLCQRCTAQWTTKMSEYPVNYLSTRYQYNICLCLRYTAQWTTKMSEYSLSWIYVLLAKYVYAFTDLNGLNKLQDICFVSL